MTNKELMWKRLKHVSKPKLSPEEIQVAWARAARAMGKSTLGIQHLTSLLRNIET